MPALDLQRRGELAQRNSTSTTPGTLAKLKAHLRAKAIRTIA